MDLPNANGDGNVNAIFGNTEEDNREIAELPELLVLQTKVNHSIRMS